MFSVSYFFKLHREIDKKQSILDEVELYVITLNVFFWLTGSNRSSLKWLLIKSKNNLSLLSIDLVLLCTVITLNGFLYVFVFIKHTKCFTEISLQQLFFDSIDSKLCRINFLLY